jgi:predicted ATPase
LSTSELAFTHVLENLTGVGRVELILSPDERIYAFWGENGVGKTKILERFFRNVTMARPNFCLGGDSCVFLGAKNRANLESKSDTQEVVASFEKRQERYRDAVISAMANGQMASLGMSEDIATWFVIRANSLSTVRKLEETGEDELEALFEVLHEMDSRFAPSFRDHGLYVDSDNGVHIRVAGEHRRLDQLSSGFASILKLMQGIICGYACQTQEKPLRHAKGLVFIDEIESHLHVKWQVHIVPLLKRLFPHTTFYVAAHSPLVLTQLRQGEAYRLVKEKDGVVRSHVMENPNTRLFDEVLQDTTDLNLGQVKLDQADPAQQTRAKKGLLALIEAD